MPACGSVPRGASRGARPIRHSLRVLSLTPKVLAMHSFYQGIDSTGVGEAAGMAVLLGIGTKVFEERLPPGVRIPTAGDARTSRVDEISALITDQLVASSHRASMPHTKPRHAYWCTPDGRSPAQTGVVSLDSIPGSAGPTCRIAPAHVRAPPANLSDQLTRAAPTGGSRCPPRSAGRVGSGRHRAPQRRGRLGPRASRRRGWTGPVGAGSRGRRAGLGW